KNDVVGGMNVDGPPLRLYRVIEQSTRASNLETDANYSDSSIEKSVVAIWKQLAGRSDHVVSIDVPQSTAIVYAQDTAIAMDVSNASSMEILAAIAARVRYLECQDMVNSGTMKAQDPPATSVGAPSTVKFSPSENQVPKQNKPH
ncbi:hypothetical protein V5O48_019465, partial [Marasmius crinis-equi]